MGGRRIKSQLAFGDETLELNLQGLVTSLEDELFVVNNEYQIKFVNAAAMQKLTGHVDSPIGRLCYEVFEARDSPCSSPLWLCPLTKVLQSGKITVIVHPRHPMNSDIVSNEHVRIAMHPLRDSHGDISAVAELRRDVTTEKEMEHQILRRHHHLQALSRVSSATSGLRNLNSILNVCLDIALESV
ncbi:MAG: PAS domain-containing protein, partial [Chloroflexota bacterium]